MTNFYEPVTIPNLNIDKRSDSILFQPKKLKIESNIQFSKIMKIELNIQFPKILKIEHVYHNSIFNSSKKNWKLKIECRIQFSIYNFSLNMNTHCES